MREFDDKGLLEFFATDVLRVYKENKDMVLNPVIEFYMNDEDVERLCELVQEMQNEYPNFGFLKDYENLLVVRRKTRID